MPLLAKTTWLTEVLRQILRINHPASWFARTFPSLKKMTRLTDIMPFAQIVI